MTERSGLCVAAAGHTSIGGRTPIQPSCPGDLLLKESLPVPASAAPCRKAPNNHWDCARWASAFPWGFCVTQEQNGHRSRFRVDRKYLLRTD